MKTTVRTLLPLFLLLGGLLPASARAAEQYLGSVSLLGGLGGSFDAEPRSGYNNTLVQGGFAIATESDLLVALRLGQLDLNKTETFAGAFHAAKLQYLTVAGEYRIDEGFYHSGLVFGVGAYRLTGDATGRRSEDAPGVCVGVTGEFRITRRVGFLFELLGHYANFKEAQTFATAQGGLAIHF